MGYKIMTSDSKNRSNLWDAKTEVLITLLAIRLSEIRKLKATTIITDLNYQYLRKRKTGLKKHYTPTKMQRMILKDKGY
jgi:hypothetical protein